MFRHKCEFVMGVTDAGSLPEGKLPEIAFVGRSNVGKSSLLNALVNHRNLARTSNTPGRTQQINFFNLNDQLMLVDLPGYGFAKAPLKNQRKWTNLMIKYLSGRRALKKVILLVDSRHGLKEIDHDMMFWLDEIGVPYKIILTKIDKISQSDLHTILSTIEEETNNYGAILRGAIPTSSKNKTGIEDLQNEIKSIFR